MMERLFPLPASMLSVYALPPRAAKGHYRSEITYLPGKWAQLHSTAVSAELPKRPEQIIKRLAHARRGPKPVDPRH
jgi:hypothetical protein